MRVNVVPKKRVEFVQTAMDIIERIRNEEGNIEARIYQDMASEDSLFVLTEWETPRDLDRHMGSDYFKALRWAVSEMTDSSVVNLDNKMEFGSHAAQGVT